MQDIVKLIVDSAVGDARVKSWEQAATYLESVLGAHPSIKDVAVVGVPHEKWGESVMAVVVLHEGQSADEHTLRPWCRQHLAGFKCPTTYAFITEAQMPRTATGKILHRVLRENLAADHNQR